MSDDKTGKLPRGIIVLGLFIVFSSIVHMHKLVVDHAWYQDTYSYLPPWLRELRYVFSWAQRVAGFTAAAGLLWRKNVCRLLIIFIGWFTIFFVFWKHPYRAFLDHARYLDKQPVIRSLFDHLGAPDFTVASVVWPALAVYYLLEIIFWGSVIYYLTRPGVKAYFLSR